jgi:hypothetical protein
MLDTLSQVIERASTDAVFRAQLRLAPEVVLAAYPLTVNEQAVLLLPEPSQLSPRGVDVRVSRFGNTISIVDDGSCLPIGPLGS